MGIPPKYVNQRYFTRESKAMRYTLGAFFRCCLHSSRSEQGIIFRSNKEELVKIIKRELESGHAIISYPNRGVSSHWIEMQYVPDLKSSLEYHGVVADKEERRFPTDMKRSFMRHFIRGFSEGKSGIRRLSNGSNKFRIKFNHYFLVGLNSALQEHAGVKKITVPGDKLVYGHRDSIKIYNYIYGDWKFIEKRGLFVPSQRDKFNLDPRVEKKLNNLSNKRIERAKELLLKRKRSLKRKSFEDISKEVGFVHSPAFYRAFKRITGKTPSQFLEEEL